MMTSEHGLNELGVCLSSQHYQCFKDVLAHYYSSMERWQKEMTLFLFSYPPVHLSIHLLIYVFSWISTLPFSTYHPSIHLSTHLCVQNILSPVLKPGTRLCRETQEVTQTTWFWLLYFSESSGSVSRESKNHFKYDYKTLQEL